ncbi:hypothetical protein GALMADRAFT_237013 [Galerina marginata CBS 339.88]|uniref:Uncharacterized protein n=1 Tax=Galerina marginata (strain CBS 339.88) TaxID=685588 RepID=A0A067TPM5_GALM3|nr:hypothetical protein GALMADRAFT_237013 [Galerina marginata CBS 339.88]
MKGYPMETRRCAREETDNVDTCINTSAYLCESRRLKRIRDSMRSESRMLRSAGTRVRGFCFETWSRLVVWTTLEIEGHREEIKLQPHSLRASRSHLAPGETWQWEEKFRKVRRRLRSRICQAARHQLADCGSIICMDSWTRTFNRVHVETPSAHCILSA